MCELLNSNQPISRDVEHVQLCGLRQLRRYPRQPVLSYAEDVEAAAAPDLVMTEETTRLESDTHDDVYAHGLFEL